MTTLTRRGPYANAPARLPGIQTARISDLNTRQAMESLREWVEVRLGARGDRFERAVTFRDFDYQIESLGERLQAIETTVRAFTGAQIGDVNTSTGTSDTSASVSALQSQVTALQTDLASFKTVSTNNDNNLTQRLDALEAEVANLAATVLALAGPSTPAIFEVSISNGAVVPTAVRDAVYLVQLTDNALLAAPSGAVSGHRYTYILEQDGVGGRTVTYDPVFRFADGLSSTVSPHPITVTVIETVYYVGALFSSLYVTDFKTFSSVSLLSGFASSFAISAGVGASIHDAQAESAAQAVGFGGTPQGVGAASGEASGNAQILRILSGTGASVGLATVVGSRA